MFENIPNNWKKLDAEKYCFAVTDGTHDSPKPVEYNGIYLLTSKNITSGHLDYKNAYSISKEDFEKINKRSLVEKYDILFSMIGTVGESCIVDTDYINFAIKNVGLFKLNGDKIKAKWLNYFFKTANANLYIKQNLKGGNQKYIALNILRKFPIPVPPTLGEQQEIVDVLDAASEIIRLRTACIESAQSLIPALFQEMFGDPLNNNKNLTKEKIGKIFTLTSGKFIPSKELDTNGQYPVYGGNGINGYHNEFLFEDSKICIGRVGVKCGCVHKTKPNSWITDNALYINNYLIPINETYLKEALTQINLNQYAKRAAQPVISQTTIYNQYILLPQIEQQELFAEKVQEIEAYIKTQQAELENAKTMFQSLLHHAFTGELTRHKFGGDANG